MRVAFEASELLGFSGINVYTRNLVAALAREYLSDEYTLLTSRNRIGKIKQYFSEDDWSRVHCENPFPNRLALGRMGMPIVDARYNALFRSISDEYDIIHITDPAYFPKGVRTAVVTVHDLIPLYEGRWLARSTRRRIERKLAAIARSNTTVLVPSRFVRDEFIQWFKVDPKRVVVTHESAGREFAIRNVAKGALAEFGLDDDAPFLLYVGRIDVRKNIERLVAAYDELPKQLRRPVKLVLVANGSPETVENFRRQHTDPNIIHLQNVSNDALAMLMNRALALAFVSLFEGFGIPIVEAMKCGCPVITSNATSMPEIAGDAALFVDPYEVSSIRNALERVIREPALRDDLRGRSLDRAMEFSWDKCARETHAAYESAIAATR